MLPMWRGDRTVLRTKAGGNSSGLVLDDHFRIVDRSETYRVPPKLQLDHLVR